MTCPRAVLVLMSSSSSAVHSSYSSERAVQMGAQLTKISVVPYGFLYSFRERDTEANKMDTGRLSRRDELSFLRDSRVAPRPKETWQRDINCFENETGEWGQGSRYSACCSDILSMTLQLPVTILFPE